MRQAVKLVLYYFAYQLAFLFLAGLCENLWEVAFQGGTFDPLGVQHTLTSSSVAVTLAGVAMAIHLVHYGYVRFDADSWREVPRHKLLACVLFILGAMVTFNILSEIINLPNTLEHTFSGMSRNVFGIVSIVVVAPLTEELLFRGAILGHLLRTMKKPGHAILVSALIFGLIHVNPAQVPFAFCLGLVFGWLYWRTGSLIPGILGHFLNNATATLLMALTAEEEMQLTTTDYIGPLHTCLLLAVALILFVGMYFWLDRNLSVK